MVSPKKLMDNSRIGMKILLMKKVWRRKHFWNTEYIYLGILLLGYLVINYRLVFSHVEISMYPPSFFLC